MRGMRLRLVLMGAILSLLGVGLLAKRGYATEYVGLLGAGVILLVAGMAWRPGPRQGVSSSPS